MTYSEKLLAAIKNNNFSQDRILLKKALDHDQPDVLASLAENLTGLGFTNLSKEIYRALIAKFPQEDLFKVYLAEILLNDGVEDDALSLLYAVPENSNAYLESLLVQADYYQSNGFFEVAKDKLLQAQKKAPHEDAVTFGLAELAYQTGDFTTALANYQNLLKRQHLFGEVNLRQRVIACLAKLGQYEQAAQMILQHDEDILDIDSKYEAGLILLAAGKNKDALNYLEAVIKQAPDYVNAYPLLARAYQKENDFAQELRVAQMGLAHNELDESLYSLGADAAVKVDDLKTAQRLLEKGHKIAPENSDLLLQLSNLYLQTQQDTANVNLLKAIKDEDIEGQMHWNLAVSYARLEKNKLAQEEFLLAYPDFKNNQDFLYQMIVFLQSQAAEKEILKDLLQRYLKLVPDDAAMQDLFNQLQ